MNEAVRFPQIVIIEAESKIVSTLLKQLENNGVLQELEVSSISEKAFLEQIQSLREKDRQPEVVCLPIDATRLPTLVRAMDGAQLDSHLFLVLNDDEDGADMQRRLQLLPLSHMQWSTLDAADESVGTILLSASEQIRKLRQYKMRVRRANMALTQQVAENAASASLSGYYLTHFLAYSQDAIVAIDREGQILFWSSGAERLFGVSQKKAVASSIRTLPIWSPELADRIEQGPLQTGPVSIDIEHQLSGKSVHIETLCSAVRDEHGNYIGMSLISRDISERHRAFNAERERHIQQRLIAEKERQRLHRLFEQAPGFIAITTGFDHVFSIANRAYLEVIGNRSIIGKPAAEALPEMRGQEFLNLLDHVFQSRKPYIGKAMPLKIMTDRGADTRFVDFVFQPIVEEDGSISGVFCQGADVTQHKRTQEKLDEHLHNLEHLVEERTRELKASQEALFASQKLEAIGKLTGGVAHDFNNVLQIIAGNLELLDMHKSHSYGSDDFKGFLSAALDAVTRGKSLSSQLLAFARRQPLKPVPTNLGRLLRNMDHLLRRALGETVEIETVVAGGLWSTSIDPNQFENVVLNLALNAKDAMPNGGRLTLEVGNALLDDHYVALEPDIPAGQYVLVAVSDTGMGMPQDVIAHAFEPFFTTKGEGKGTGLGLSMAYGFIKQSGGHIRIYSELNKGTTFKMYLPRTFEPEVAVPTPRGVASVGGTETILVVEDDVAVRTTAVLMLKELGYSVLQAGDGQSALTVLQSGVSVDLLFSDVVMPGPVRSTEVAKHAQAIFPNIEVLFTSGYTQNAIVHGGRLDPGVELLSKPYRREDLARKIRQILDSRSEPAPQSQAPKHPLQILLVEDDAESQSATQALLTALGHEASAVGDAEEALIRLREQCELLITDINLPGMSGSELIEQALHINPQLRVIVASGDGAQSLNNVAHRGVVQLTKPFNLTALQEAIHQAMQ